MSAILEMRSITKTFPGVKALDDVHFDLHVRLLELGDLDAGLLDEVRVESAGKTTPKVVQLIPMPTSKPMPTTSIAPDGAIAARARPAANAVAPKATTGVEP